jgi:hypothetical protein
MKIPTIVGVAAIAVSLSTAKADSDTRAEQLAWECQGQEPAEHPELGPLMCTEYVLGMLDMYAMMADPRVGNAKPLACLPDSGISGDQGIKIFLKWANDHPEQLHNSARMSFLVALRWAFPCQ